MANFPAQIKTASSRISIARESCAIPDRGRYRLNMKSAKKKKKIEIWNYTRENNANKEKSFQKKKGGQIEGEMPPIGDLMPTEIRHTLRHTKFRFPHFFPQSYTCLFLINIGSIFQMVFKWNGRNGGNCRPAILSSFPVVSPFPWPYTETRPRYMILHAPLSMGGCEPVGLNKKPDECVFVNTQLSTQLPWYIYDSMKSNSFSFSGWTDPECQGIHNTSVKYVSRFYALWRDGGEGEFRNKHARKNSIKRSLYMKVNLKAMRAKNANTRLWAYRVSSIIDYWMAIWLAQFKSWISILFCMFLLYCYYVILFQSM